MTPTVHRLHARRSLDRERNAYVSPVRYPGGTLYFVTDGVTTIEALSDDDARRIAYVHNHVNGFGPDVESLRADTSPTVGGAA